MRAALDRFLTYVTTIEKNTDLRAHLLTFGQTCPGQLSPSATTLRRAVRELEVAGLQPSLDGSILLIASAFERFVSELMIGFTDELPNIKLAYSDLPKAIRSANENNTGDALSGRQFADFSDYDLRLFVSNLKDCHVGVVPYTLNGAAIALNSRNLKSGQLRTLISRLGVNDIWKLVSSTKVLQRWSGPGGAKIAAMRAQTRLNELINDRNYIAHRVGSTNIGPEGVISYIKFGRAFTKSLVKSLENHAQSI